MSQPETARELCERTYGTTSALSFAAELARRVEQILERHQPPVNAANESERICCECMTAWPCKTMRLLNGQQR